MGLSMKCLRCGYCCTKMFTVIVIDPTLKDPCGVQSNLRGIDFNKERCPHLNGDKPGEYSCGIHHYPWFKKTPCGTHSQVEGCDSPCRMGVHILSKESK